MSSFSLFLKRMEEKGFVVNDNVDENDNLEHKFKQSIEEDLYHIMILPTYQCNLRCWYCTQKHENMWMTEETVQKIQKLLLQRIKENSIKRIRLSWFGGEPLLGFKQVLDLTGHRIFPVHDLC